VPAEGREQIPSIMAKLLGIEWPRLKLPSFSDRISREN